MLPRFAVVTILVFAAPAAAQDPFPFPPPGSPGSELSFWATAYWVHKAESVPDGVALLDMSGKPLGPTLTGRDWCASALEGTVQVASTTYNYVGSAQGNLVDCSKYFVPKVGGSRFAKAKGRFGDGVAGFILVPYRTLATDKTFLKPGTSVFIPSAVGQILPDGTRHDGYFFVGDGGGAIKGNHVDVFQGLQPVPFTFIRSKAAPLFKCQIVADIQIRETLLKMHRP